MENIHKTARITHAGGIVARHLDGRLCFMMVTANSPEKEWVFPKGHIEAGESPEQTALREIREEAGVEAILLKRIGTTEFEHGGKQIVTVFFILKYEKTSKSMEKRDVIWCDYRETLQRLSFEDQRELLRSCRAALGKHFTRTADRGEA